MSTSLLGSRQATTHRPFADGIEFWRGWPPAAWRTLQRPTLPSEYLGSPRSGRTESRGFIPATGGSCRRPGVRRPRRRAGRYERVGVVRIKICGITTPQEGLAAAHAGADALGCLVGVEHLSPDGIPAAAARWVFAALPPYVARVLVTHRATLPEIEDLVAETAATVVQLHGDFPVAEIPRLCSRFPYLTIVKAVPVTGDEAVAQAR